MTGPGLLADRDGLRLHVRGVVQGVGFRPFVHRLALRHGLAGQVRNESGEVFIEVEGEPGELDAFRAELAAEAPPLARIDALEAEAMEPRDDREFRVAASELRPGGRLPVSPDVALCAACERELFDPADRRHRYPFVTCTDCGPRFTVIESMPYDRERTTMRAFQQCPECLREYGSPDDRRYHSQTNACPACGPRVALLSPAGSELHDGRTALVRAAQLVRSGQILAVRGLGGFHLAVDATRDPAVRRLRERKAREAKPLAVMVRTLEDARRIARVGRREADLLTSAERPIVLLRRRDDAPLAVSVAPGLDTVGVMTAYTPLHHLLLDRVGRPVVMTSGNLSDEPIAIGVDEALERLRGVADAFLVHDREIVTRCDDSVVRMADGATVLLRRARGYAPLPVELPVPSPLSLVGVGPHLKNTLALADGGRAFVSQHIGDLEDLETLRTYRETLEHLKGLYAVEPTVAVRDLHPGYLSTREARQMDVEAVLAVQHHHAHVAAVAGEHGFTDPLLGLAFDGTGYGEDGRVWGAEFLVADLAGYERVGRLRYVPLPGGEAAVRNPWRSALGYRCLAAAEDRDALRRAFETVSPDELRLAKAQAERRLNAPEASSMGRLFDAAAAVLGVRRRCRHEAQAAMELEALAGAAEGEVLPFPVARPAEEGVRVLDPVPLLAALGHGLDEGRTPEEMAAAFHETVAAAAAEVAREICDARGLRHVALGGGVFQNARLLASLRRRLEAAGLAVLVPRRLGPGDGAVSYGQVVVGAARLQRHQRSAVAAGGRRTAPHRDQGG